ncbi:L-histidine N(alpha)-methyltransferase [Bacillus sp. FJAT-42376]|uniref:L-histidine N(alpha)-methyltransferase n=1 Tax=Bacillus sp. FJAT-42376 TaxID=2014076 RepID=UPI000F4DC20F|nr:L-histidine N(alpha)-methyltransferase [Bacillus sp. FJAT-42376]AZB42701.1 L-histidine N(alpha)-methyltransferase [Bacillus sp. FJAT-42376]
MKTASQIIQFTDCGIGESRFLEEALEGLKQQKKTLPAKFLYDERGSELFEEITGLQEYYPTRTEIAILERIKKELADLVGPEAALIEFGSGSSRKINILLQAFENLSVYVPIDISKEFLYESCLNLSKNHPSLFIHAIAGDYTVPITLPPLRCRKKTAFFPGSTIGNFNPEEASRFLDTAAGMLDKGDGFLVGVDLKKDTNILNDAYNDSRGITAEFNLNLLKRMNRELGADFHIDAFRHHAFYNEEKGCIEMHIVSKEDQTVTISSESIVFKKEESIHTESSYKYEAAEFQSLALKSGFAAKKYWTDENQLFSIHYLELIE